MLTVVKPTRAVRTGQEQKQKVTETVRGHDVKTASYRVRKRKRSSGQVRKNKTAIGTRSNVRNAQAITGPTLISNKANGIWRAAAVLVDRFGHNSEESGVKPELDRLRVGDGPAWLSGSGTACHGRGDTVSVCRQHLPRQNRAHRQDLTVKITRAYQSGGRFLLESKTRHRYTSSFEVSSPINEKMYSAFGCAPPYQSH